MLGARLLLLMLMLIAIGAIGMLSIPGVSTGLLGTAGDTYTLTVTPPTNGSIQFQAFGPGQKLYICGQTDTQTKSDCTATYGRGAAVMARAVPMTGKYFGAWAGTCGAGVLHTVIATGDACDITMVNNFTASATFKSVAVLVHSGNNESRTMGPWSTNPYRGAGYTGIAARVVSNGSPVAGANVLFTCNQIVQFPLVDCGINTLSGTSPSTANVYTDADGIARLDRYAAIPGSSSYIYSALVYNRTIERTNTCDAAGAQRSLEQAVPFTITASYGGDTATFTLYLGAGSQLMWCEDGR